MTPFRYLVRGLSSNRAATRPDHPDPRLRCRRFHLPAGAVWAAARTLARETDRWHLVECDEGRHLLRIEARTRVLKFVDEVELRVRAEGEGQSRVEMKSRSRVGRADFGTNARRIAHFLHRLDTLLQTRGG